jgi:thiol-disulfide isomerase/thioredoxin
MRASLLAAILSAALAAAPAAAAGIGRPAPELAGGGPWINTGGRELRMAELRGKVVAIEIWTAGCYNCLNVLPALRRWHATYRASGLVIVGVHSPEFAHERSEDYVRRAVARLGVRYPVVMDNAFRIWRAYRNVYWPTLYLVDRRGTVRYSHVGEGRYEATEAMIRRLLAETP